MQPTPNDLPHERLVMEGLLHKIFAKYPQWSALKQDDQNTIVRRTIRTCELQTAKQTEGITTRFKSPKYLQIFSTLCSRVLENIDPDSEIHNLTFGLDIISGKINPKDVMDLTSFDMYPEASQNIVDNISIRKKQKVNKKYTEKYKCSKCGNRKCSFIQIQTRAADEISSFNYECLSCGHSWFD